MKRPRRSSPTGKLRGGRVARLSTFARRLAQADGGWGLHHTADEQAAVSRFWRVLAYG